uniref:TSC22 domain family member 3 n=1 Tax=Coturnix japonica TaxID=93934 RepID=A0A8C2SYX2_COTJA
MSSSPGEQCRSPVGLDCCSCCLDLVGADGGENNNPGSPTASGFRQLREQLEGENLNAAKLSSIMRQDSLEPVVRDPCYLLNQGICNRNIDQTLLSILLLFHRWGSASDLSAVLSVLLPSASLLSGPVRDAKPGLGKMLCFLGCVALLHRVPACCFPTHILSFS